MYQPKVLEIQPQASDETMALFRRYGFFHICLKGASRPLSPDRITGIINRFIAVMLNLFPSSQVQFIQGNVGAVEFSDDCYLLSPFAGDFGTGHPISIVNISELILALSSDNTLEVHIANPDGTNGSIYFDPHKSQIRLKASSPVLDSETLRDKIVSLLFAKFLDVYPGFPG